MRDPSPSNIRSFARPPRGRSKAIQADSANWAVRLLVATVYLGLAWILRKPEQMSLELLMVGAFLYWIFIHQKRQATSYFLRFHLLQALVVFLVLVIGFQLFTLTLQFILSLLAFIYHQGVAGDIIALVMLPLNLVMMWVPVIVLWTMLGVGSVLALAALLGKTPRIPFITANVSHWA